MKEAAIDVSIPVAPVGARRGTRKDEADRLAPWRPLVPKRPWVAGLVGATLAAVVLGAVDGLQLGLGIGLFLILVILPLRVPFETALLIVATGWIPLEGLVGSERDLFASLGGLNVSGMRLAGGAIGLTIAVIALRRRLGVGAWPEGVRAGVGLYLVAIAWLALTLLWGPDPVDGLRASTKLAFPLLVAGVVVADPRALGASGMLRLIAKIFAVTLVVATAFGVAGGLDRAFGIVGGADWDLLPTDERGDVAEWYGWAGWSTFAFLAGTIGVLFLALSEHRLFPRAGLIAALALVQIPLMIVRIAVAAVGAAITAMIALGGRRPALAPLGLIAAVVLLVSFPPLVDRNVYDSSIGSIGGSIGALGDAASDPLELPSIIQLSGREVLWERALGNMESHEWIRGRGFGAWATEAREAGNPSGAGALHGEPVRLLYEGGAIGLVLFVIPFIVLFVAFARRAMRQQVGSLGRGVAEAATGALVLYGVASLTDNTLDYYLVAAAIWTVIALPIVAAREDTRPSGAGV